MNDFQRSIIEELIFKPRTAEQLAWDLQVDRETVHEALEELSIENIVRSRFNVAPGDAVCSSCGEEYENAQSGAACVMLIHGGTVPCRGYLIDICLWAYCGGPISKALEVAA